MIFFVILSSLFSFANRLITYEFGYGDFDKFRWIFSTSLSI